MSKSVFKTKLLKSSRCVLRAIVYYRLTRDPMFVEDRYVVITDDWMLVSFLASGNLL